jgi:hypothetical protein
VKIIAFIAEKPADRPGRNSPRLIVRGEDFLNETPQFVATPEQVRPAVGCTAGPRARFQFAMRSFERPTPIWLNVVIIWSGDVSR